MLRRAGHLRRWNSGENSLFQLSLVKTLCLYLDSTVLSHTWVWCALLQTVCDAKCALEFLPFMAQCGQLVSVQNSGSQMAAFDALETTCQGLSQDEVLAAIGAAHCPARP